MIDWRAALKVWILPMVKMIYLRQRIALARVYYRDTPIVVMDEPSAMLDPAGEAAFRDAEKPLTDGIFFVGGAYIDP